jgi:hypothetical protein
MYRGWFLLSLVLSLLVLMPSVSVARKQNAKVNGVPNAKAKAKQRPKRKAQNASMVSHPVLEGSAIDSDPPAEVCDAVSYTSHASHTSHTSYTSYSSGFYRCSHYAFYSSILIYEVEFPLVFKGKSRGKCMNPVPLNP